MHHDDFTALRAGLQEAVQANLQSSKVLLALRTEMVEREQSIRAAFSQELQSLRNEVATTHREVVATINGAKTQIAEEAKAAIVPVAAQYDRAISATSAQIRGASKTVWMWFAAGGSILLLVLLVGWAVLGYYQRELTQAKDELIRYENAVPVVQAFYASDATICDGRICVNVDRSGKQHGDKQQYVPAKPRQ